MVRVKWLAALSSGSVVVEHDVAPGELSAWQQLLKHLQVNDLYITGMRLQVEKDGEATRTYNLPSHNVLPTGQHPKWNFIRPIKPIGYGYRRATRRSLTTGDERRYVEVYAGYEDGRLLSLVVDEMEGTESWTVLHAPDKLPILV